MREGETNLEKLLVVLARGNGQVGKDEPLLLLLQPSQLLVVGRDRRRAQRLHADRAQKRAGEPLGPASMGAGKAVGEDDRPEQLLLRAQGKD